MRPLLLLAMARRVFQHVWTVNLKFLPEDTFQAKGLAAGLLCAHLLLLLGFAHYRCARGVPFPDQLSASEQRAYKQQQHVCGEWSSERLMAVASACVL